jgi:RHS repeat-associated protein
VENGIVNPTRRSHSPVVMFVQEDPSLSSRSAGKVAQPAKQWAFAGMPAALDVYELTGAPQIGFLRFYEPNLQRWINRDPIGERGCVNLQEFVGNNPINYVDLLGLFVTADNPIVNPNGPWAWQVGYNIPPPPIQDQLTTYAVFAALAGAAYASHALLGSLGLVATQSPQSQNVVQSAAQKCAGLAQQGQGILQKEKQLFDALNQAAANVLKVQQQIDLAKNATQYASAQEQAAAAQKAYEEALQAWASFMNQLGH